MLEKTGFANFPKPGFYFAENQQNVHKDNVIVQINQGKSNVFLTLKHCPYIIWGQYDFIQWRACGFSKNNTPYGTVCQ